MLGAMTEPQLGGTEGPLPPRQPQYQPPPPGYSQQPPGYPPPPGQYPQAYMDPAAPYGRHPLTGEPLSDKSKIVAGLLQLIGLFGLVGIGRIYLGYAGLGRGATGRRPDHVRNRCRRLGRSSTPSSSSPTRFVTRRDVPFVRELSAAVNSRARLYGALGTGALLGGGLAYVGLADPHRADFVSRHAPSSF